MTLKKCEQNLISKKFQVNTKKSSNLLENRILLQNVRAVSDSSAHTVLRARPTAESGALQLNCQLHESPHEAGQLLAVAGQSQVLAETANL